MSRQSFVKAENQLLRPDQWEKLDSSPISYNLLEMQIKVLFWVFVRNLIGKEIKI
jgi:hypothetical protein